MTAARRKAAPDALDAEDALYAAHHNIRALCEVGTAASMADAIALDAGTYCTMLELVRRELTAAEAAGAALVLAARAKAAA